MKEHNDDDDADSDGERLAAGGEFCPGPRHGGTRRGAVRSQGRPEPRLGLSSRGHVSSGTRPDARLAVIREGVAGRVRGECPGVVEDAAGAYDDAARTLLAC